MPRWASSLGEVRYRFGLCVPITGVLYSRFWLWILCLAVFELPISALSAAKRRTPKQIWDLMGYHGNIWRSMGNHCLIMGKASTFIKLI